jgi:hypothetical protein
MAVAPTTASTTASNASSTPAYASFPDPRSLSAYSARYALNAGGTAQAQALRAAT